MRQQGKNIKIEVGNDQVFSEERNSWRSEVLPVSVVSFAAPWLPPHHAMGDTGAQKSGEGGVCFWKRPTPMGSTFRRSGQDCAVSLRLSENGASATK